MSLLSSAVLSRRGGSLLATSMRSVYMRNPSLISRTASKPSSIITSHLQRTVRNTSVYTYNRGTGTTQAIDLPAPPASKTRFLTRFLLTSFFILAGVGVAAKMQISVSEPIRAHMMPDPETSDPETLGVESLLTTLPIVEELRSDPTLKESRPHLQIPLAYRAQVLTAGVLSGPNRIVVPPIVFHDNEGKTFTSVQWLGKELCGHPGIIHGGLLATILDEGLARCAFLALPNHVAMTASLEVNYRAPCMAEQAVILKATTTKVEGRKAWVEGRIETVDGTLLVEAKALMIEPRQAKTMKRLVPTGVATS